MHLVNRKLPFLQQIINMQFQVQWSARVQGGQQFSAKNSLRDTLPSRDIWLWTRWTPYHCTRFVPFVRFWVSICNPCVLLARSSCLLVLWVRSEKPRGKGGSWSIQLQVGPQECDFDSLSSICPLFEEAEAWASSRWNFVVNCSVFVPANSQNRGQILTNTCLILLCTCLILAPWSIWLEYEDASYSLPGVFG